LLLRHDLRKFASTAIRRAKRRRSESHNERKSLENRGPPSPPRRVVKRLNRSLCLNFAINYSRPNWQIWWNCIFVVRKQ
jgi:hypothetical protein